MIEHKFDLDEVVEHFKIKKVKALHKKGKLFDFLEAVKTQSPGQMQILNSWKNYFTARNIPWAVTEHKSKEKITKHARFRLLWKEQFVDPGPRGNP